MKPERIMRNQENIPINRVPALGLIAGILLVMLHFGAAEAQELPYLIIPEVNGIKDLEKYGEWTQNERFGRIWRPYVVEGWRPFYFGHWLWTTYGWTWISYEPFGWIVFHYGEWSYDRALGWFWIPGQVWFAAPVVWFKYSIYVGWAAKSPPGIILPQPWLNTKVEFWNVVKIDNFLREKVGDFVKGTLPERPSQTRKFMERPPGLLEVQNISKLRIGVAELEEESIPGPSEPLKRLKLPEKEMERVERHRSVVVRRVLKPKLPGEPQF